MKNKLSVLFSLILFSLLLLPCSNVKAEELAINTLVNSGISNAKAEYALDAVGINTNPNVSMTSIVQTNATETSITVSWSPVSGISEYLLYTSVDGKNVDMEIGKVSGTSYTLVCGQNYLADLYIYPVISNDEVGRGLKLTVGTLPTMVGAITYDVMNGKNVFGWSQKLGIAFSPSICSAGYDVVLYNSKGKKVQTVNVSANNYKIGILDGKQIPYYTAYFSKSKTNNVYRAEVKPYLVLNKVKKYGKSNFFYAAPDAKTLSIKKGEYSRNHVTIRWKKVTGATKYDIYASKTKNGKYKKVGSVKGNKTSFTFKKFGGKSIDLVNNYYYVKIITNGKIKGKKFKSSGGYINSYKANMKIIRIYR